MKNEIDRLRNIINNTYYKNISFRSIAKNDVFPLFVATRDENFNRFLLWPRPVEINEIYPEIDKLLRQNIKNDLLVISLCEKDTGKWLGVLKFTPYKDGFEITVWIHPDGWNKGVVINSAPPIVQIFQSNYKDIPLYVRVYPENIPMKKILRKYGFVLQSALAEKMTTGEPVTLELYSLDKNKWVTMDENEIVKY
jgi:RimJ/RimL family protein N-acetyltransferase